MKHIVNEGFKSIFILYISNFSTLSICIVIFRMNLYYGKMEGFLNMTQCMNGPLAIHFKA